MDTCIDFAGLAAPFAPDEVEWRLQQAGEKNGRIWCRTLPYLTSRSVMDRLDLVVGPGYWKTDLRESERGMLCGLSLKIDGEWVTKWDGSDFTDIEPFKGGVSGALKRAAVSWGIGRYLYSLEESFGEVSDNGSFFGKTPDGKPFRWNPPRLPAWALPGGTGKPGGADRHDLTRAREERQQHEARLAFIRAVYDRLDGSIEVPVHPQFPERGKVALKKHIRDMGTAAKSQASVSLHLVETIETHTDHRLRPQPVEVAA